MGDLRTAVQESWARAVLAAYLDALRRRVEELEQKLSRLASSSENRNG